MKLCHWCNEIAIWDVYLKGVGRVPCCCTTRLSCQKKHSIPKKRADRTIYQREYHRKRRQKPESRYKKYQLAARERNISFDLTFDIFMTFWQKACTYCGEEIETIGLDRVNNEQGYSINNIVSCCARCNRLKNSDSVNDFIERLRKIIALYDSQNIRIVAP